MGIISGLVAALFGAVDWSGIPSGTKAKRVGVLRGLGNVVVVGLFIGSWLLRRPEPHPPSTLPIVLCFVGVALALVTGWLGAVGGPPRRGRGASRSSRRGRRPASGGRRAKSS